MSSADVAAQVNQIPIGNTIRGTCPQCGSREAFTITRTALCEAAYCCHRASCGNKGHANFLAVGDPPSHTAWSGIRRSNSGRYEGPLAPLDRDTVLALVDRFQGVSDVAISAHIKDAGRGWLALPIRDAEGKEVGHVLRWSWLLPRDGLAGPKTKTYIEDGAVPLAWYANWDALRICPLIITEDQMSALRVSEIGDVDAAALLGSDLSVARIGAIQSAGIQDIVLALDPDATTRAFDMARKWQAAFRSIRVLVCDKDPKDMPIKNLRNLLASV